MCNLYIILIKLSKCYHALMHLKLYSLKTFFLFFFGVCTFPVQSGRSKYKTGVDSFLLCMTYHADITLTYFCIYNEFVTPILKTFVFLSRYPIYRLKPLMNNLRTLATHIDRRKWKIKIFCGRKIFMKSGPSFQHFHKKSHQKCHAILPHS